MNVFQKTSEIFTRKDATLTLTLQAMSRYIALTATPKQPAFAPSFKRIQQPPRSAQARMRPQGGGKPSAQIEQEVQRIVQSVLGAAVASDLPLMQVRIPFFLMLHF